jgi:SusD family.
MKSKIYLIVFTALLLIGSTGCTNWLDTKPESQVVLEDYWKTESEVDAVLASCYKSLTESDVIVRMICWGELRSDNMTSGATYVYDVNHMMEGDLKPSNYLCTWSAFYKVINYCNTVLYYAPSVVAKDENFTQTDLHHVQSEALTIRSLCYFYLVRAFKEVPWIEDASVDDTQNYAIKKSTERELLDHIISDLKTAQQYARTDFGTAAYNKGRITLNTVNSLLADVYLWDQQYDNCIDACNKVLTDKQLKLVSDDNMYSSVFASGNSSESIFEMQFSDNQSINYPVRYMFGYSALPYGWVSFPTTLMYDPYSQTTVNGAYSPFNYQSPVESTNDIRSKEFINILSSINGKYYIFKYAGIRVDLDISGKPTAYNYRSTTPNWIAYRLSDIYLMRAEALVEQGSQNYHEALKMVNTTYLRSNPTADSLQMQNYTSQSNMEDLVLRERQREFLFEGKRWFDLVRKARRDNSTADVNKYISHKPSTSGSIPTITAIDGLYMPIAQSELKLNTSLVQNSYYQVASSSSK